MSEVQNQPEPAASAAKRRPKRRHHWVRNILVGMLVFVLVLTGGLYLVYRHLNGNIHAVDISSHVGKEPKEIKVAGPTQPMNVLIMGNDTRKGANGKGIGGLTPGLSDTAILLHLSANRKFAYGVSLPRDAMVQRPSCDLANGGTDPGGLTQFNDAFAIGGPACTIKTLQKLTHIRIDHFVVVDFVGFRKMVDAIGGVKVCVPTAVDDNTGHIYMKAGTYTVHGDQALNYVRERDDLGAPTGDIGRMKRQQAFIASMIKKVVSAGTLVNPVRLYNFLDAATKSLTVDKSFANLKDLASLGESLKNIGLDNIKFVTTPWEPYPPDTNRVEWAPPAKGLWRLIRHDKPLTAAYTVGAVKASNGYFGQTDGNAKNHKHLTPKQKARVAAEKAAAEQQAQENGLCT